MKTQKQTGVINAWFKNRGFGFVQQVVNGGDIRSYFLHVTQIKSGVPVEGAQCSFYISVNDRGLIAVDVEIEHAGLETLRTTKIKTVAQNVEVEFGGVE